MLNIFPWACWPSLSSLKKISIHIICLFLKNTIRVGFFFFFLLSYMNSSHILHINTLSDLSFTYIFSHFLSCLFIFLIYICTHIYIFCFAKPFGLKSSHLFVFVCIALAFRVKSKNLLQRPISRHLLSIFSWEVLWFQVLCSNLLIHVGLIFLCGVYRRCPVSSFCMWLSSFPSPIYILDCFVVS